MATNKKDFDQKAFSVWQALLYRLIPNLEEIIDPNNPHHQIAVHSSIHEMAAVISDRGAREAIQNIANRSIANIAQKNAK